MDIGRPLRIHNIPDPHRREIRRFDWEEVERRRNVSRPHITRTDEPIPVPDWPTKKPVEVEVEPN